VLDYAYEFQRNLGKKAIIINDGGMHFYRNLHLGGVAAFNFMEEYNKVSSIEHKGEVIEFLQVSSLMPNLEVLHGLLGMIYELNPLLVFDVGGSSLLADLCTSFVTTATMPCRVEYPITCSEYMLVARNVFMDEPEYKNKMPYQYIVETNFNYVYRKSDKVYSRSEFGIPENAFLCMMVGYRIGNEVDDAFLDMLEKTYLDCPEKETFFLVFVGIVEDADKGKILSRFSEKMRKQIVFTGLLTDASEFIKVGDLFLNPERNGGGRAAFESLYFGIPVITLASGDVYYVSGKNFGADNYGEYSELIERYRDDKDFYSSQSSKAKKRAEVLSNMKETLAKILEDIFS
jgi:hypothetical protein